jgi:hypothetical protein
LLIPREKLVRLALASGRELAMNIRTISIPRITSLVAVATVAAGFGSGCVGEPKNPDGGEAGDGIGSLDGNNNDDAPETEDGSGDGDGDTNPGDGDGDTTNTTNPGDGDGDGDPDDGGDDSQTKFDLAGVPDASTNGCLAPFHDPCDDDNDPWHAMGINCPGEWELTTAYTGHQQALYVHTGQLGTFNNPPTYPTLEGEQMVILSSGIAQQLTVPGMYASTANPGNDPMILPPPLTETPVDAQLMVDCIEEPNYVGLGDCSNTIYEQWEQGSGAYDYAELRLSGEVPGGASGFSYNLAFFSTEYPVFYQSSFNDMYIAWLESEIWTGNVSFDEMGHPISLNAGFLDYKDAPNQFDCPNPCEAPELMGTAMQDHAGTKWLTTTAGVVPGEDFTLVFAIFDLSDNILDSVVILDNFAWNCEGGPPVTVPG